MLKPTRTAAWYNLQRCRSNARAGPEVQHFLLTATGHNRGPSGYRRGHHRRGRLQWVRSRLRACCLCFAGSCEASLGRCAASQRPPLSAVDAPVPVSSVSNRHPRTNPTIHVSGAAWQGGWEGGTSPTPPRAQSRRPRQTRCWTTGHGSDCAPSQWEASAATPRFRVPSGDAQGCCQWA